jgi:hypothetical protein
MTTSELENIHVEISKLMAETSRLNTETGKLDSAVGKINFENFWYPMTAAVGLIATVTSVTTLLSKFV